MIDAFFYKKKENYTEFSIKGHSGFLETNSEDGDKYDLVCAAVSILAYTTADSLENTAHVNMKVKIGKSGYFNCNITHDDYNESSNIIMETMINGIKLLANKYPENIKITIKEVE